MIPLLIAVGVATPAGLNAYIVLFVIGLAARITGAIVLPPPFDLLSNTWVLVALGALLTIDVFLTKAPRFGRIGDRIGTIVRPLAGGIAALAATAGTSIDPLIAGLIGIACAGAIHWLMAAIRPAIVAASGGQAVPLVSLVTDMIAAAGVILTLRAPVAGAVMALAMMMALGGTTIALRRRTRPTDPLAATPPPKPPASV